MVQTCVFVNSKKKNLLGQTIYCSVGLEHIDDLIKDFEQALDKIKHLVKLNPQMV